MNRIMLLTLFFIIGFPFVYGQKPLKKPSVNVTKSGVTPRKVIRKPSVELRNGHECVDLGLSVKWATCNMGAASKELSGDYYSWGAVNSHHSFERESCTNYGHHAAGMMTWNNNDIVRKRWGGKWRLPTNSEIKELITKCSWKRASIKGCNGYLVKGKNGNTIFLPATGFRVGTDLINFNRLGFYWSSIPYGKYSAYALFINGMVGNRQYTIENVSVRSCLCDRSIGRNIRPVFD